jgi:hypothetical protein
VVVVIVVLQKTLIRYNVPTIYAACTGYMGDAKWIIKQLQLYVKAVEERYDDNDDNTIPLYIGTAIAIMIQTLFWGYDTTNANIGPAMSMSLLAPSSPNNNDNTITPCPRPIGVRTALITVHGSMSTTTTTTTVSAALSTLLSSRVLQNYSNSNSNSNTKTTYIHPTTSSSSMLQLLVQIIEPTGIVRAIEYDDNNNKNDDDYN